MRAQFRDPQLAADGMKPASLPTEDDLAIFRLPRHFTSAGYNAESTYPGEETNDEAWNWIAIRKLGEGGQGDV